MPVAQGSVPGMFLRTPGGWRALKSSDMIGHSSADSSCAYAKRARRGGDVWSELLVLEQLLGEGAEHAGDRVAELPLEPAIISDGVLDDGVGELSASGYGILESWLAWWKGEASSDRSTGG